MGWFRAAKSELSGQMRAVGVVKFSEGYWDEALKCLMEIEVMIKTRIMALLVGQGGATRTVIALLPHTPAVHATGAARGPTSDGLTVGDGPARGKRERSGSISDEEGHKRHKPFSGNCGFSEEVGSGTQDTNMNAGGFGMPVVLTRPLVTRPRLGTLWLKRNDF